MHKSHYIINSKSYLILSVIAFALGIILGASPFDEPFFTILIFLTVLFCVLTIALIAKALTKRNSPKRIKHILLPWLLILFFGLGFLRIFVAETPQAEDLRNRVGDELWLSGTITSPVTKTKSGFSQYFEFEVTQADSKSIPSQSIIMYIPKARGRLLSEGDQICCWTTLKVPKKSDIASNFDYYTYLRGKNIFLVGETKNANKISLQADHSFISTIKKMGRFVKTQISSATDVIFFDRPQYASIMKGILVGDKTRFSDKVYKSFSNAGISHIVSVSGMHLSILFSLLTLLFYKLHTHKKLGYILSVPFIILLASAAGFTPSVCRSALMLVSMIVAMLLQKRYSPANALFLSLGIILFIAPYSLFSASLILSFGATFAIVALFGHLFQLLCSCIKKPNLGHIRINSLLSHSIHFVCSSFAVSISAFVGTCLSSACFFGTVSVIQLFTNLWIIPTVTVAFCLGFVGCLLFFLCPRLTVAVLYYPLRFCVGIISKTADILGKDNFVFVVESEKVTLVHLLLYLGFCVALYLISKHLCDLLKEKQLTKKG